MNEQRGHVFIVGAGPGDPELITVAGAKAIAQADVILYDALSPQALLRGAKPGAELRYVGKRSGEHALGQREIEALIVQYAREGKTVARLKGGDPFVFGRGSEEAQACRREGIAYTVVPGITSAIAAPAYAGIPVTHRGLASGFMVITGNEPGEEATVVPDWEAAARADTLVILMGVATLEENMRKLAKAGKDPETPVACIRWGTRSDQEVLHGTIDDIAAKAKEAGLRSPVVTVVGGVAALRPDLEWFRPGPLGGKRVVVTRARAQASDLSARLEALGAHVVEAPVIAVKSRSNDREFQAAIAGEYDWLVVTSANGATAVFGALGAAGLDSRQLAGRRIAAVGEATAEALDEGGLRPDFVPSVATSEVLGIELPVTRGQRVLLAASALTDERLRKTLEGRGATVTQVAAYDNVIEPLDEERKREVAEADVITFTSASTARNLREAMGETEVPETAKLVSIGPQTSSAVREAFGRLDREAAKPGIDDLVEAVLEVLS